MDANNLQAVQIACNDSCLKEYGNRPRIHSFHVKIVAFFVDACVIAACGLFLPFLFRNATLIHGDWGGLLETFGWMSWPSEYVSAYCVTVVVAGIWMLVSRSYRIVPDPGNSGPPSQVVRAVEVCAGFSVAILAGWIRVKVVSPVPYLAENWLLGWWALGLAMLFLAHHLEFRILRRLVSAGRLVRETIAVVGSGPEAAIVVAKLLAVPGLALAGVFDDRRARRPREVLGVPVSGGISELAATTDHIDRIIIAFPLTASRRTGEVVKRLSLLPVEIGLAVDIAAGAFEARGGTRYCGTFIVDLVQPAFTDLRHIVKRVEDIILSSIFLVLLMPFLLTIAAAIKLDSPGPVLFRQPRYGRGGRLFQVLKFRTMYVSATDVFGDRLTETDDRRVTRFGRLLRKSSFDELPQFFNVLKGDMSIVGPRPHALRAKAADVPYADAVETYAMRFRMKPGITGWAQVNGWRGETNTVEQLRNRIIHDLYYIDHWSLWWDLYIIGRTTVQILSVANPMVKNAF